MIQKGCFLKVNDNSGASMVCCIHVYKKKYGIPGDLILVSVKKLRKKRKAFSKVYKGLICKAVITRTKNFITKRSGFSVSCGENSVVILNKSGKPLGTRVLGGVSLKLRYTKFMKVASMAKNLIK